MWVRCLGLSRAVLGFSLGAAISAVGCGGRASSPSDGAAPSAGTSGWSGLGGAAPLAGSSGAGGGHPNVPRLNGVPIGDCREPTDDERTALGCPRSPPSERAACDLAPGITCAYSLSTDQDTAYQDLYLCASDLGRQWWRLRERCGALCVDGGPHVLELDAADCTSRPPDSCELPGTSFSYAPSGDTLLSYILADVIESCSPGAIDFSVTLELAHGCATRLSTTYEFSPAELACLREKLESVRYTCGELLPCTDYAMYLI
ncbi:MAG TPA: hypothetical protein VFK05_02925 [Polyangiaceae bacterium]|nr:hypothetical protein [Polyangiaceae bacterium]